METQAYQLLGVERRKVLTWSVIISLLAVAFSCKNSSTTTQNSSEIHGETQGTTYTIILAEEGEEISKKQIDSIFENFDSSLSTYISESTVTLINNSKDSISIQDEFHFFKDCYRLSAHVYDLTDGNFDPSVFPLVKAWGFMSNMDSPLNQQEVDSILQFVSFEKENFHSVSFRGTEIRFTKKHSNFMLDFNAIAQGQSVDVIATYLDSKGYSNYYVEVGGELKVKGKNREGINWQIGIDVPEENLTSREVENILSISDKAVATSGNYRKFYIKDGVKYAHTLNPKTGFPVQHSLLSVTVVADNCAKADAYATAFMVMGKEAMLQFVENHPEEELEVYLLSAGENDEIVRDMSKNFNDYLVE